MPQYSRATTRRRRRRTSRLPIVAGVVAVLVLIGVGVVLARPLWHKAATGAPHPAQQPAIAAASLAPASTSAATRTPSQTSSADAAAPTTASAQDPGSSTAAAASNAAARRAAVQFPGAPAISATTRSLSHLRPAHKYIALTLDDGYNFQPQMLELLQQYDAHCTTFLVGSWAATHKSDLKLMKNAGFEIANHSWTHPSLTKLSSAQIASQLTKTQTVISSVTGNQAPYLRPPFGATDAHVKAIAASLGYRIVMWDRTFGDSGRGATPAKLYDNAVNSHGGVQPGDIILCHWGSKMSYEALKKVLPDLKAQGYEFVTISELVADSKPLK